MLSFHVLLTSNYLNLQQAQNLIVTRLSYLSSTGSKLCQRLSDLINVFLVRTLAKVSDDAAVFIVGRLYGGIKSTSIGDDRRHYV